jgi:hypothetical protein
MMRTSWVVPVARSTRRHEAMCKTCGCQAKKKKKKSGCGTKKKK